MYSVYTLNCPITGFVMYVGCTNDLDRRKYEHLSLKNNTAKSLWIQQLKSNGLRPIMTVLERSISEQQAIKKEAMYIDLFLSIGMPLKNMTNGGKNPPTQKGKKLSDDHKLFLAEKSTKKKQVFQYDKSDKLVNVWDSVKIASKSTGICHKSISTSALGKRKSAGGYLWSYIERN